MSFVLQVFRIHVIDLKPIQGVFSCLRSEMLGSSIPTTHKSIDFISKFKNVFSVEGIYVKIVVVLSTLVMFIQIMRCLL